MDPHEPVLAVVQLTDSFEGIWPDLVPLGTVELLHGDFLIAPAKKAFAIVVAAGGAEQSASAVITTLGGVYPHVPVCLVGVEADHRVAIAALRAGAADYFVLPDEHQRLWSWVSEQMSVAMATLRTDQFVKEQRQAYNFGKIMGRSPALREVLQQAALVIPMGDLPVLITGETGTGKELLAQAIHAEGPRASAPFVEVNCAALPGNLLEAELFGYEKGAFTDAKIAKPGLLESANGGTLFLDEIGDLPLELQGKLLKVLEDRRVRRLGSVRTFDVDVRIIAATHVNLADRVRAGGFRTDLYYRLDVIALHLPPLRERGEDALELAEHFVDRVSADYKVQRAKLPPAARAEILRNPWLGNVRELRHAVTRAVLMGGGAIDPKHFSPRAGQEPRAGGTGPRPSWPITMDELETWAAREAVRECQGNKSRAADLLNISRNCLRSLLAGDSPERES